MRALLPPWCWGDVPKHLSSRMLGESRFSGQHHMTWWQGLYAAPLVTAVCVAAVWIRWQLRRSNMKLNGEFGKRQHLWLHWLPFIHIHRRDDGKLSVTQAGPLAAEFLHIQKAFFSPSVFLICCLNEVNWTKNFGLTVFPWTQHESQKKRWHIEMDWGFKPSQISLEASETLLNQLGSDGLRRNFSENFRWREHRHAGIDVRLPTADKNNADALTISKNVQLLSGLVQQHHSIR